VVGALKAKKKAPGKINKGVPSGLMVSLVIHGAAFLLAGLLVVFTVTQKEEKKFVPPKPVERPKMKLKKPKVKVKKNNKPKPTTRIVTKVKKASMPDIQLPEMSGMSDGLVDGLGGFEMEIDLDELSVLGSSQSIGSDLEGTYYDLKLDRGGRLVSSDQETFRANIIEFVKKGWRPSTLYRFYRSPNKIYATTVIVPITRSSIAPSAFGDKDASGAQWMVHYKGQLVHAQGITFRFWAAADETLLVRLNGKIVVGAKFANVDTGNSNVEPDTVNSFWQTSERMQSFRFVMGNSRAVIGDWITLEPGVPQDIDILIADNGGAAGFYLAVEEEGVEYPESPQGGPLLPVFKMAPITRDMMDVIYKNLPEGEVSLTNGPIFNDYNVISSYSPAADAGMPDEEADAVVVEPEEPAMRIWTLASGESFEAEFINVIGTQAAFRNGKGRIVKIPVEKISESDRRAMGLASPPKFDVNFVRDSTQKTFAMESFDENNIRPPETRSHYGVRIEQTGTGNYPYMVYADMYVIGQERLGDKYILLDRQSTSFTPTAENRRSHEFKSPRQVVLQNYEVQGEPRGEKFAGYLVVLTDERGKEIDHFTTDDWLYEKLGNLKQREVGQYMDENCVRVFPTRPPATLY